MTLYFRILILLLTIAILGPTTSCKRKKPVDITISGIVTDDATGSVIQGASIKLEVKEIQSGTFNSGYQVIDNTSSSGSGKYSFVFERRNASEYRITVTKNNYFGQEEQVNPDNLDLNNENTVNLTLNPKAWLRVNANNVNPFDSTDQLSYYISVGAFNCGSACCDGNNVVLTGDIDTSIYCLNSGGHDLTIQGFYVKNSAVTTITKTVYMTPLDTSIITVDY